MRKFAGLLMTAAIVAGGIATNALAQETIKIGVTQPLTGAFAASGNYVAQGAKIAEDEINKAGGVLGKKLQLIIEDNKSNPTEAVSTVEKLIQKDKVPVLIGAWSSTLTLAAMPKLEEYQVPMIVETSSSGKITTSGNPYIFRISPTSAMEAKAFQPLVAKSGIKKADFLYTNNDFGIGSAEEYSKMLKANGVTIGVTETMDPKATDFSAQLAKIKASGADTLFVTTAVEQLTIILKQAKEQQLTARIISCGGSNSPDQLIEQRCDVGPAPRRLQAAQLQAQCRRMHAGFAPQLPQRVERALRLSLLERDFGKQHQPGDRQARRLRIRAAEHRLCRIEVAYVDGSARADNRVESA